MCLPFSISAVCCSGTTGELGGGGGGGGDDMSGASFTFSKVVLTSEEAKHYQLPWEKQQEEFSKKKRQKSSCVCWCCLCTCLVKPVNNRLRRRVSNNVMEKRAACYKQLIDVIKPSADQVAQWSTKFEELLQHEGGRRFFDVFLQQEHSEENLMFWSEVNRLRDVKDQKLFTIHAREIYLEFLKPMSSKEINIGGQTRKKIEEDLQNDPPRDVYEVAQIQVYNLMQRQSYPRFLASDLFTSILQNTYTSKIPVT